LLREESDPMPRCILSTVGTSVLTNAAPQDLAKLLRETANLREDELSAEQRSAIDHRVTEMQRRLEAASIADRRRLSAELNGLYALCGGHLQSHPPDSHFLLATDTYQGQATAGLIRDVLESERAGHVTLFTPSGLSTRSQSAFVGGIREVIRWCDATLEPFRDARYRITFNLVGSFKSLQGYLNTIGMFYADEIIYIFEDPAASLIRIPRLPIQLDLQFFRAHRDLAAQLAENRTVPPEALVNWPETLWEEYAPGQAGLSTWGALIWERGKQQLLDENLLHLPRLVYERSFIRDFEQHANRRERVVLQECLARVSVMLQDSGGDPAVLKRHGGLRYDNYSGANADLGHFRVNQNLCVSCRADKGQLHLLHFGGHDAVNDHPR
jgi:CRISPR/Cas system-associated protein Csm6